MSVWNQHDDFLAEEVAALAITDATESIGLLSLMHKAYDLALRETETKYLFINDKIEIDGKSTLQPYRFKEDPLPEEGLYSVALQAYKELLFVSLDVEQYGEHSLADVQKLFDTFRNEKNGEHPSLSSQFEIQQFSRKEISRWLQLNKIESIYTFSLKNQLNTKKASKSSTSKDGSDPSNEANKDAEWISIAKQYANEFIIEKAKKNSYPNQNDIGDHVAKRFRAEGINAAHGKPPSGSYIKRYALTGIRAR